MADTPGFGEIGLWDVDPRELDQCFRDFRPLLGSCRFQDCAHVSEPECAVREAVRRAAVAPRRAVELVRDERIASNISVPLKMSIEMMETIPASIVKPIMRIAAMSMPVSGLIDPSDRIAMKRPPPLN